MILSFTMLKAAPNICIYLDNLVNIYLVRKPQMSPVVPGVTNMPLRTFLKNNYFSRNMSKLFRDM